jgi:Protein of unknown function (DUF559)
MSAWRPAVHHHLRTHHGVVTRKELLDLGLSPQQVKTALAHQELRRVQPGVFISDLFDDSFEQRAVVASIRGFVVAKRSAARIWGLRRVGGIEPIEVMIPHGKHHFPPEYVVYQTRALPAVDITERDDGIIVTTAERTVSDLANRTTTDRLEQHFDRSRREGTSSHEHVFETVDRRTGHGHRGSSRLRLACELAWADHDVGDSTLELQVTQALRNAGFPSPVPQYGWKTPAGPMIHIDLAYPTERIAIEVDGPHHQDRSARQDDRWRDTQYRLGGWTPLRVDADEVHTNLQPFFDALSQTLHYRRLA